MVIRLADGHSHPQNVGLAEVVTQSCSVKTVFLAILQNSQ